MGLNATLNTVARPDADPAQARAVLASLLDSNSLDVMRDIYVALRAWVWKALDQRRRDPELREWHDIIAASSAIMAPQQPDLAAKLDVLHELVGESIAVSERVKSADVTKKQHVTPILRFLAGHGGAANRMAIGARLGLKQANLTRVLNLMVLAGLVERNPDGKQAVFQLTHRGTRTARVPEPVIAPVTVMPAERHRRQAAVPAQPHGNIIVAVGPGRVTKTMVAMQPPGSARPPDNRIVKKFGNILLEQKRGRQRENVFVEVNLVDGRTYRSHETPAFPTSLATRR